MSAKSTISLFFDNQAIDFPKESPNEDLARLMPQISQLNVWPCEDGSCGLCRVILIGWPTHPGPIPMELCQVDINQLQGVSLFSHHKLLEQLPVIHREALINIGCALCRGAQTVSIIGFSTWRANHGQAYRDWVSLQVQCWQCRRDFYGGLLDDKYHVAATMLVDKQRFPQEREFPLVDESAVLVKPSDGFEISTGLLLAQALALPMLTAGPWCDLLIQLRQYLTWHELFKTTLAGLIRHPIHGRLFETLLHAYDVETSSEFWSFPDLDRPRIAKHEILITPLSNQVAYLACGYERKGARLKNVRWAFAVHDALPPIYCKRASLVLEETHINPARLKQTIDKMIEEVRARFRLTPEWATAITQSCHRIAAAIQAGEP